MRDYLFFPIYVIVLLAIGLWPINSQLDESRLISAIWAALVIVVVFVIEFSVDRYRNHVIIAFSKRLLVLLIPSILSVLSILIIWLNLKTPFRWVDSAQFILIGCIIGVLLRQLTLSVVLNGLFGRNARYQRLLLLSGLTVVLWLFPIHPRYAEFRGFYLLGVSFGLIAHIVWRQALNQLYMESRYRRGILEMLGKPKYEKLSKTEKAAFDHFVKGHKWRFRRTLSSAKEAARSLSPFLTLLEANSLRVSGRFQSALKKIETALNSRTIPKEFEAQFLLQKALAYGEIEGEDEKMFDALEKASRLAEHNILINATLAIRKAEKDIPLTTENPDELLVPLRLFRTAVIDNKESASMDVVSTLKGSSIPRRWGFLHDVYGYVLLRAGDFEFSRDLFLNCIEKENGYSSSYLHLGEWYLKYADFVLDESSGVPGDKAMEGGKFKKLAKDCFEIAFSLERTKDSRIARRAKEFLSNNFSR